MCREMREKKIKLLLNDFDLEVEKRIQKMTDEIQLITDSIQQMFEMSLMSSPEATRNMLWRDSIQQEENKASSTVKDSIIDIICSADNVLKTGAKKRGRKPKQKQPENGDTDYMPPPTVLRTTRSSRQRPVLGSSQTENMPPPSTRRQRTKNVEPVATPLNSHIPPQFTSSLFVTPKFDPRTPLPTGTVKRKPLLGEVAISLQGSPLQVSPPHTLKESVEDWMARLDADALDDSMRSKLVEFHKKVENVLKM